VRRLTVVAIVLLVVVAALLAGSFPARQIVAQRRATPDAETRVGSLATDISHLQQRVDALEQPDEIERLARDKLGLVRPGQESYRVMFPPSGAVPVPRGWPFVLPDAP
jgi:cell division protein FtsB